MSALFEEMWILGLELQVVTYPVVNAATVTYAGHPNVEIGTDMDQDINGFLGNLTAYKDYSVHNVPKPLVLRYPIYKHLQ